MKELFEPSKVAVVGASRHEGKTGHEVYENLMHTFDGETVPVNPNADSVDGSEALDEVPHDTELAVFAVPAETAVESLEGCAPYIDAAVVVSAGFSETGNHELEDRLVDVCEEEGVSLLGPNVLGIINTENGLNASFASTMPEEGSISFMSQSGAFCTAVLDYSKSRHVGFRHFVSLGNKALTGEVEMLEHWHQDSTETVMGYTEGIEDGRAFMEAARKLTEDVPVVMVKAGRTEEGGGAATSHTGSIAGSIDAYRAAFEQSGVIEAESNRELLDLARTFSSVELPDGESVAVVTNAGGPGVIAVDEISENGLGLAELRKSTRRKLEQSLPGVAKPENPVDVIGDAGHQRYEEALEAVLADEGVDSVLVLLTPQSNTEIESTAMSITRAAEETYKPVLACFIGDETVRPGREILEESGIPEFADLEEAVGALAALGRYRQLNESERTFREVEVESKELPKVGEMHNFEDYEQLLEGYGFDVPLSALCETPKGASEACGKVGFPTVAKLDSPEISHKTEVDGVITGIESKSEMDEAFTKLTEEPYHATNGSGTEISGVLVQEQIEGLEVALGMQRDPQFGPVVMVGLGGIYVEALHDVSFGVAPISEEHAERMIEELESHELFEGARGKDYSKDALVDALIRMGKIGLENEEIKSIDVNPLILTEDHAFAADIELELG